ncbi:WYL domain-containing protein [Pasteurellaceae bacterium LIM206]|nr:WYL domain-containing protein [Pasteurellaceae bacterium LIM206]
MVTTEQFIDKNPDYSQNLVERLAFIDIRLNYLGEISRNDIMAEFKIAQAAASKDLNEYRKLQGDRVKKDFQSKKTVIEPTLFQPLFKIKVYDALDMLVNGFNRNRLWKSKMALPIECVEIIENDELAESQVVGITRALHNKKAVLCEYQSSHSGDNAERLLFPNILFVNKEEWYFRAYQRNPDQSKSGFKNFKFSRVLVSQYKPNEQSMPTEQLENDDDWQTKIPVQIQVNDKLDSNIQDAIRKEFQLESDTHTLFTRAALFAFIRTNWRIKTEMEIEQGKFAYFKLQNLELYRNIPSLAELLDLNEN